MGGGVPVDTVVVVPVNTVVVVGILVGVPAGTRGWMKQLEHWWALETHS